MSCKSCESNNQTLLPSEICIHFPGGLKALAEQAPIVFSQLLVCLNCGFTQFSVPDAELQVLARKSNFPVV
jgi:hypothetical protein